MDNEFFNFDSVIEIEKKKSYNQALEDFEKCAIQQSLYIETEEGWSGMTIDTKTIKNIKEQLRRII